jgi:hypothetical protein
MPFQVFPILIFWGAYNLIEPDKSIETAIEKIQKSIEREKAKTDK